MKKSELRQIIREEIQSLTESSIKKGDTVLYKYNKDQGFMGTKTEVVALKVRSIEQKKTGEYVEVFHDGRRQTINTKYLDKTNKKYKDGEVVSSKAFGDTKYHNHNAQAGKKY
jgi:hypothetical protein